MKFNHKALLLLSCFLSQAAADTPAKCSRDKIYGHTWDFHVSKETKVINLYQAEEVCTHKMPNRK